MPEVPKRYAKLDDPAAVDVISSAYTRVAGQAPSPAVLALLAAQADVETAGFNVPNNNWGGVKEPNAAHPFFYSKTKERDAQGVTHDVFPPDPVTQFASRDTPEEGAEHWIRVIMARPHWWEGLHTENLEDYVSALATAPKYFTAAPAEYLKAMSGRLDRLLPLFEARLAVAWVPPARSSQRPQSSES